jgi:hypothetical protein
VIAAINARIENPTVFGAVIGVVYFLYRVLIERSSPAQVLVNALYIAAIAVLVRIVMNRWRAARK